MFKLRWHSFVWVCILAGTVATLSACGGTASTLTEEVSNPNIVARFAGEELTVGQFEGRYARSVGGRAAAVRDSLAEYEDFLSRYVDFRLKVTEARANGLDKEPALLEEIEQYKKQLATPYLIDQEVVDRLVKDLYERQQEEISASHILVRIDGNGSPEDTLAAYQRIKSLRDSVAAGASFAEIAARNSDDPSAARNSGYLGVFTGGRMIEAFEDRAYETPVDSMSDIFRTRFGYHVLMVHSRGERSPDIRASHILVRAGEDDTLEALATIREIMEKLQNGVAFSDLASEYSADQGSAANGGDLGFFGRGRMVAPFEEAAFALESVGDVSEPVRSRFGYHLIKLTEVGELPTYEEAYEDLKAVVQRLPRFQEAQRALAIRLKGELTTTIDTTTLAELTSKFPRDSTLFGLALEPWTEAQKATVIATMGDRPFTLGDFLEYGGEHREQPPSSYDFDETLATLDRMLIDRSIEVAASRLEETDADFRDLMNEYRDGILLFRVMEDSVWNRANTDTVGLMAMYEANAEKYRFPARKRVISFYSSSDSTLTEIAARWSPGDTTDWGASIDEDGFRVDTTFVSDSTNSIYDVALSLEPGETSQPTRYRRGFMLFALDGIEGPRRKTFKEARADVVTEYQAKIEVDWLTKLRTKYDAKLYPENLRYAFTEAGTSDMTSGR